MEKVEAFQEAMLYASDIHKNKKYAGGPYMNHILNILEVASRYRYLCENEEDYHIKCKICILHDAIEDCEQSRTKTYREIKDLLGLRVAEGVYCVSDELGRTRSEEKAKTYPKVKSNKDSIFAKLADRITNLEVSINTDNKKMIRTYVDEQKELFDGIYDGSFQDMWDHLQGLVSKALPML